MGSLRKFPKLRLGNFNDIERLIFEEMSEIYKPESCKVC